MSEKFYSEQLGCSADTGYFVSKFMEFCHARDIKANPWSGYGITRVYIEIKSQNKMLFHAMAGKVWFCPKTMEIICDHTYKGRIPLREFSDAHYSGAKTREKVKAMIRDFDNEKYAWVKCS